MSKENKQKSTVWVVSSTKGGVGKTLTSIVVANLLYAQKRKFKIIEIDDNNDSLKFERSEILNELNAVSFNIDQKDEAVNDMFYDLMDDDELDYIIDCGGGNDTRKVLKLLEDIPFDKKFLLPCSRNKNYIKNADETFEIINDSENTYYILNQYSDIKKIKDEFLFFFGNEKKGIKPSSKYFDTKKYLKIPFSNSFQIADDEQQTILDLAMISHTMTKKEAIDMFYQKSNKDRNIFNRLMPKYQNSCDANEVFSEISKNFQILFK